MKKYMYGGLVLIIIIVGFFMLDHKKASVVATQATTIKLGLMMPLTSPFGAVAEGVKNASLLAVADWEATHPNVHVETVVEDDAYSALKGISAYQKMKTVDHIDGMLSISTPVVDALYKTYQTDGLPVVNLGTQTEGATNDNIFQIFPDAKGQIKPLADYLQNSTNYDSITIVHTTNDPAYAQFYNEFIKIYTKSYKDVSMNSKEDSKSVASKVIATKSHAVVIILTPALGSVVTKDIKTLDTNKMDYFYDASLISGFDDYKKIISDATILNGATTIKTVSNDLTKFKAAYKAKYGTDPTIFAESGYDSVMIMLNSYDSNKATWVKNIQNSSYTGPSGKTTFDDKGIRTPEYVVTHIVNGQVQ